MTAALLTVFNRPDKTQIALDALLSAKPRLIYVSGDGPRPNAPSDTEKIEDVWRIVDKASEHFPIETRRRETNEGSRKAVTDAIDWVLGREPSAIIIEDDVQIDPNSWPLACYLVNLGMKTPNIGSISMFSAVPESHLSNPTATFRGSIYSSSQYWGTWPEAWLQFHGSLNNWRSWLSHDRLEALGGPRFARFWSRKFDRVLLEEANAWDYPWLATNWSLGLHTLVTNTNYCINHGFDEEASFSPRKPSWFPIKRSTWDGSIVPPSTTEPDPVADAWTLRNQFGLSLTKSLKRALDTSIPGLREIYLSFAQSWRS